MKAELTYVKSPNFPYRYILPSDLEKFLQENLNDYIINVGSSTLGKPIYMLRFGTGKMRVLAWSQMHGNESNATHAMLDLWESLKYDSELKKRLFSKISLDFIFMLNPDGAEKWTRRNALEIDLNRDFLKLSSKELSILKKIAENGNYHYAFNLHEQRTIFTTDGTNPATISFLAPSENESREITDIRKKSMAVISYVYREMSKYLPQQIGRYTDEFYPTSVGDNFTKLKLPTILYEGGHFIGDYKRENTRKFYTLSFYEGLKAVAELEGSMKGWEEYLSIPENKNSHYDIIYRNVTLNTKIPSIVDIAIQYEERVMKNDDDISFIPIVQEVGDLGAKKGWKEIDCTGKSYVSKQIAPKINTLQDFEII